MIKLKNYDYIVQEREPEFCRLYLHTPLFPVNIRLYKSSPFYQEHIQTIIKAMTWHMSQRFEDYQSNPAGGTFGISCANLGMGYNIIGWRCHNECHRFMLNPVIVEQSKEIVSILSNCGSINLKEKIPVKRNTWILVNYYDLKGIACQEKFTGKQAGFTIQHEIDHNQGILITDRYLAQGGDPELLKGV